MNEEDRKMIAAAVTEFEIEVQESDSNESLLLRIIGYARAQRKRADLLQGQVDAYEKDKQQQLQAEQEGQ